MYLFHSRQTSLEENNAPPLSDPKIFILAKSGSWPKVTFFPISANNNIITLIMMGKKTNASVLMDHMAWSSNFILKNSATLSVTC